ncbi:hypothetical protein [Nitrosarchaeum sp. AC2]|uniref:DUF7220 family protein n=1 Tax=Nitrosarchaeum sp. AC2 TaxID=2259673 RepID=UPI0015CC9701|nr:hypothetical protein [Nitrosarchaeum sp. AC2]QLH11662.1 hypothetical protein DSQ20_09635 [Nitrosarchaeum sp. AC2]
MTKQIDSYKKSLFEATANLMGGYPMMFVAGIIILPLSANWIKEDPLVANITITGVYASINFTRSFLLRRLFAKYELHDNLIKLVKNLVRK